MWTTILAFAQQDAPNEPTTDEAALMYWGLLAIIGLCILLYLGSKPKR